MGTMDRQDGKDPFAATTYVVPMTINTMIELRAFCAAFFEENLRAQAKSMDQDLLTNFISLIAGSKKVFARARAVIPELQLLGPSDTSKMNPNVQRVMQLTEHLRRWPDADYDDLPEESVWSKLAKDGEAQRAKEAGVLFKKSLGHKRQASAASSPLRPRKLSTRPVRHASHH